MYWRPNFRLNGMYGIAQKEKMKTLILIAKLYLWGCRRNQTLPVITAFSSKVKIKYETGKYICVKTNNMGKFNKKWALPLDSVP